MRKALKKTKYIPHSESHVAIASFWKIIVNSLKNYKGILITPLIVKIFELVLCNYTTAIKSKEKANETNNQILPVIKLWKTLNYVSITTGVIMKKFQIYY